MATSLITSFLPYVFCGAFALYVAWESYVSPLKHIPGPVLARYTDLWRFLDVLKRHPEVTQRQLHDKHGPYVRLGPNMVSVSDPEMITKIYSRKSILIKGDFYKVHDFNIDGRRVENIFTTRDEHMNTQILKPVGKLYSMGHLIHLGPLIDKTITSFLDHLNKRFAVPKMACDIDNWLHYCAWDVIGEISFGQSLGFMAQGKDVHNMLAINHAASDYVSAVGMMPWLDMCLERNPIKRIGPPAYAPIANFVVERITTRKAGTDGHDKAFRDMLDDFIEAQKADPSIQDDALMAYVGANVIAGSDTVAAELRSILYHLCKSPAALSRLQKELDDARVTAPVSWVQCHALPYLCACVSEGLRIFPGASLPLERRVGAGGMVMSDGKTFLPQGTLVGINPYVVNRDRGVYGTDAESFRPERWLQSEGETDGAYRDRVSRMKATDLTFGAGKRICLGRNLALIEIHKIVASLFKVFEVKLVSPESSWKTHNAWLMRQSNMDVYLRLRG